MDPRLLHFSSSPCKALMPRYTIRQIAATHRGDKFVGSKCRFVCTAAATSRFYKTLVRCTQKGRGGGRKPAYFFEDIVVPGNSAVGKNDVNQNFVFVFNRTNLHKSSVKC